MKNLFNNFNSVFNNFNETIGYLVFKKIFLGYLTIVIIISIYQGIVEIKESQKILQKSLKSIETLFSDQIRSAVMTKDDIQINKTLNIISKEEIISGILLVTKDKKIYFPVDRRYYSKEKYQAYKFRIYDSPYFKTNFVADVEFYIEKSIHQDRVLTQLTRIGTYFIIFTFLFWILIVFYTNKYLTIPLKKLIDGIREFEEHDEEKSHIKLQLNNLRELTILADAFNKMSGKISEDIINLKQLTMIQNLQKKALEDANRAKDDFLANMSHELKTPLNSINLISSIMMKNKNNKFDEKDVKNFQIINNCGNDLLFLINDVLDISKLEAGKLELYYETLNAKRLMYEIKDMFEPQVLEKNLNFVFNFDKNIEFIYSDKQRIKQIVKNLLSNSLKFVHEGEIRFLVEDESDFIKITISDDGIGIENEKLNTIFDRFKQVDGSTTRKYGGTGLGLAICKDLVGLFKGEIKIESEIDIGTTVTVLIPKNLDKVNKETACEIEEKKVAEKKKINEVKDFLFDKEEEKIEKEEKKNILILNNNPINYMQLIIELNKKYKVKQDSNIKDFISKIEKENFDLLIIDMDCLTKEQLNTYILHKNKKAILVNDEEIEGFETINKPFDKNQMVNLVEKNIL
ncbi:HAMP domain-containing sensor histidine kinase [Halarcobacter sp.]|uniref:sensor histidine kinase n=1 Tax=Halarcobacter sp. TaxID=2321133 RepID=UPI002AA6217D|nr:HAMP domain-containing sensor histidine kinase [Halarcobacter sp.]